MTPTSKQSATSDLLVIFARLGPPQGPNLAHFLKEWEVDLDRPGANNDTQEDADDR